MECEHEYGFERWLNRDGIQDVANNASIIRVGHELVNHIGTLKDGIIPAMQMLEAGYNEMKEHLDTSRRRDLLPATNIMKKVNEGIGKIEQLFLASKQNNRKLLHDTLDVPDDGNTPTDGDEDWETRYEAQDLPNIGERRSLLKKRGAEFNLAADKDSTIHDVSAEDSLLTPLQSNTSSSTVVSSKHKRKSKSQKEMVMLQNQRQQEEALRYKIFSIICSNT